MDGKAVAAGNLDEAVAACRPGIAAVAAFSLFANLLILTVPLYMLQVFDRVLSSRSVDTLVALTAIALAALLAMAALEAIRGMLLARTGAWLDGRLGGALLAESVTAALRRGGAGNVQGLRDLATVRDVLSGTAIFPLLDAPWTPIFIAVTFMLHPLLGWLALAAAILLLSLAVAGEAATRGPLVQAGGAALDALGLAEVSVRNADAVSAMGMMPNLIRRWDARRGNALGLILRASHRAGAIAALSRFLRFAFQIGMLSLGAWLAIQGQLTAGGMIAGSILLARALAPVDHAIGAWRRLVLAREAWQRVKAALRDAPPRGAAMALPAPAGRVTVEDLTFAHDGARRPIVRGLSFAVAPGEVLGLVGPSATGKTTLARLLVGNLRPAAGRVLLDGMDVSQWDRDDVGRHIGYLPQDVELFAGTVHENIARMGEGEPEAVVTAARLAGAHETILGLPKGYDTEIGPNGAALSGGDRQRIALARALYGAPRLVVLDEPDAHLDREGQAALLGAIAALKQGGAAVVVITHRAQIVHYADSVLLLRAGAEPLHGPRDAVAQKLRDRAARARHRLAPVAPSDAETEVRSHAG